MLMMQLQQVSQTITIQKIQRGDSVLNLFDDSIDGGVSNQKLQSTVLK